jgi:hypothetical protein
MIMEFQKLNLNAENAVEQRVLDYLLDTVSDVLAEKINSGKKTLGGAVKYATDEARKMAAGMGSICVDDATVFGWIVHFFEEDDLKEGAVRKVVKAGGKKKGAAKGERKPERKADAEKPRGPMVLDLFTGVEVLAI